MENNQTSLKGELEINLSIVSNLEESLLDDTSSIGSDLSFIQKEPTPRRQPSSNSSPNRLVGGTLPEAGKSSNWSFNTTTQLQQETEVKLTELSIIKMHLDRVIVEKENLEAIQKQHLKEIQLLQNEIKQLKLQRVTNNTLQEISSSSINSESMVPSSFLSTPNLTPVSSFSLSSVPITSNEIGTLKNSTSSIIDIEKSDENVKLSIDFMLQLQHENKELKDNLNDLQLKYQNLLEGIVEKSEQRTNTV